MKSLRLTVGQAVVRFLSAQWSERDGERHRLIEGCFGIFGHGNVAGIGEGLLEAELETPGALVYYQARNEQAMVHAAVAFARVRNRLSTLACTSSIGPGATNMVTGAAVATINRLPVLLLPGDVFATRVADPVLQQLEHMGYRDVSVNDVFRPVSRFFDRVERPEQLPDALLGAMRALERPGRNRCGHGLRGPGCPGRSVRLARAAVRAPRRGTSTGQLPTRPHWRGPATYCAARADRSSWPEAESSTRRRQRRSGRSWKQRGCRSPKPRPERVRFPYDHPQAVGAIGVTGSTAANALARSADVVVGIGTRWSDFTTASRTVFAGPGVRFINCNITRFDASKQAGTAVVGDARTVTCATAGGALRVGCRDLLPRGGEAGWPSSGTRPSSRPTTSARAHCPRSRR